jgi:pyruvate,water dikinase
MTSAEKWIARAGEQAPVSRIGGKATGLERLVELELDVPPFVVLTADAYRACCSGGAVPQTEASELAAALDAAWSELAAEGVPLAVRSSAVDEDGTARSWAGQLETRLNVTDRAMLARAVLACWRSLHGERARAYRVSHAAGDAAVPEIAMALVIQQMLEPRASGVVFTMDPVTGDEGRVVVSAVLGLGEGLVSGKLDADTWVLSRSGQVLEEHVVEKPIRLVPSPAGGVREQEVPAGETRRPALDAGLLRELTRQAIRAEGAAGHPLDMEFAVQDGRVLFLQARPITTAARPKQPAHVNRLVWDNSNIVESYPGITLPLTFSFIRRAYHAVYWQFCELIGMRQDEIRANDHMLRNMLGLHRGRVYYNLRNWYRLVSILPGFRHNRRFMEGMMGVTREGGDEKEDRVTRSRGAFALASTAARAVWLQTTLARRLSEFQETFDRVHGDFESRPYEAMGTAQILEEYRRLEEALLWRWKAPIVNDFSVMVFYGLLKQLTVRWGVDPEGSLHNVLVAHQGGIESTEGSERLEKIADLVRADTRLWEAVLEARPAEALGFIRGHEVCGPVLEAYMQRFGDRCVAELKLETRTMRDDPAPLVAAIRASLRRSPERAGHKPEQARVSEEAAAAVRATLSFWRRPVYRWVLTRARAGIRARENQRLARTRAFALVRRMMRCVGRRLSEEGLIEREEDVFYLELDELMGLCDGTATLLDPRALLAARKNEFRAFEEADPLPERFVTYGTTVISDRAPDGPQAPAAERGILQGLAAYPGLVERTAVVMLELDPSVRLDGEILVTRQTDPGWVILFPSIGGLVVERGSMLSHSAIVAREMGIPAVVGVRGATQVIRTGHRLRLDGRAGVVRILDAPDGEEP